LLVFAGIAQTYAQAPKLISFNPASGPVGIKVTITGSGFDAVADSNVVYFGATRAIVNTASASRLSVTVPVGATYKPITVINKVTRLMGQSTLFFSPGFSPAVTGVDPRVRLAPATAAADVQIRDIDGDGKTDIITTDPATRKLMVFHNKATAGKIDTQSFAKPVMYPTGQQPGIVSVDDLNGDGKPDVILLNVGYSANPNGNNSLSFFQNLSVPGRIRLSAVTIIDSTETAPAVYHFQLKPGDKIARISDLDGDGKPDLAVLNTAGSVSIYRNIYVAGKPLKTMFGAPVTITLELKPTSFTIGDMDSDGKPDIVATNYNNSSMTLLRNSSTAGAITAASFQRMDIKLGFQPLTVNLTDVDGDGKPDAVIARPDNKPTTLIHNTSIPGRFAGMPISLANLNSISNYNDEIILQDINGDAKPDLLTLNADLSSVYLYTNKSVPGQTSKDYFDTEVNCPVVTIPDCTGDLDGDGRPDMIIGSIFGIDIYRGKSAVGQTQVLQPFISELSEGDMDIYPNPASVSTNVKYTLPLQSDVLITVRNNYGQLLQTIKAGKQDAGSHVNAIETSNLKMGVYVITLSAGNLNKTGKLLIK
ncbi:MAG: T9SS type A sorting domain-containing protein, partial [Sphingobacteriales bacterium]